jgi:hypothetical protein
MLVEYKNIDPRLIVQEVRGGRSLDAIGKLFGIKTKREIQELYMKGLAELGDIPGNAFSRSPRAVAAPAEPREASPKPPSAHLLASAIAREVATRTLGESGSITLNKSLLVESLGFSPGDKFEVYREGDRIVMKKTR